MSKVEETSNPANHRIGFVLFKQQSLVQGIVSQCAPKRAYIYI